MAAAEEEEAAVVVDEYRSSLEDLKMNSKPLINMLTMLAEENRQYAAQFVQVIEDRALKAPTSEKLPAMYLIDSIIKNLSDSNYLQLFSKNIVTTFAAVFEKVDEKTRSALFKLRHTWNELFPMKVLYGLDLGVRDIDPAWPVLPGAKIHVNPKFLPKVDEKKEIVPADKVIPENLEQRQQIQEDNRKSCSQLENDILLKQQLMAKQQEILKLHQQRLEFELAKARTQIELQAKLLQKEKQAAKERDRGTGKEMESTKRIQLKDSVSLKKQSPVINTTAKATTEKVIPVRPSNRDPRIRAENDARTSNAVDPSQQKRPVVSSSKTEDRSLAAKSDSAASSPRNASGKTATVSSGNIFDQMLDLSSNNTHCSPAKNSFGSSEMGSHSSMKFSRIKVSKTTIKDDDRKTEKRSHHGKRNFDKDKSAPSKSSSPQKKTAGKEADRRPESRVLDDVHKTSSSKIVSEGHSDKDSSLQPKRPLKSSHPRPTEMPDQPPAKIVKHSDPNRRSSNFKPQRLRKNSIRDDLKSRGLLGERRFDSNRKRNRQNESSCLKGSKKPKPTAESDAKDCRQLSDDLIELFGNEDKDYRLPGGAGASPPGACRDASGLIDNAMVPPNRRRDSLLLSPSIPSSQSSGWAQFKASRPEDFPFQQQAHGMDGEVRSSVLVSPGARLAFGRRAPLLPTPPVDGPPRDSASFHPLRPAGLSGPVTMDTLEKQMTELHRLQDWKKKLDEQQEHLIRNSSLSPQSAPPNVSPVDPQFSELHRLEDLKRNLDEQQERLQAIIDSGMKISDEFNSVFPTFDKDLMRPLPPIRNRYLDINDDSSKSPIFREGSPRRDRRFCPEERGIGLLGDRPQLPEPVLERKTEETKVLLPTPRLERPRNIGPTSNRQDVTLSCEDDRFYYPERDPRWALRVQMQGSRSNDVYNVVIDGRYYEMTCINRPLSIWLDRQEIMIRLDLATRTLWCNDSAVYHLGEDEKSIKLNGILHRVFVRGPPKKLWIDNQLFNINVDSPPEKINIGGKEHKICIDGGNNRIIVDGFDICSFGTSEPQVVKLAFVVHNIQFHPPCKQILIDGKLCNLDLSGKFPVVIIDGKARGIRFDGPPQIIFVDDKPWTVPVDTSRRCHVDGPSSKLVVLAFGGPGHEIIVDDQWYELKFGGVEKYIKVGRKMRKFQLKGSPPEVKILGEIFDVTDPGSASTDGRSAPSEGILGVRPHSMQSFESGVHRAASELVHNLESGDDIPSLLNLNFDSQMERSRFPVPKTHDGFSKNFLLDRPIVYDNSIQPVSLHGPDRPVEGRLGPGGSFEFGQRQFAESEGLQPRLSQNNEFVRDQHVRMPFGGQEQMGTARPSEHLGPRFGPNVHQANQNFDQFSYGGCIGGPMRPPWAPPFSAAPEISQESSSDVDGTRQEVDMNSLLSKLLAAGLIKNPTDGNSSDVNCRPPKPLEDKKNADGDEELAKKEEETIEDVPTLTDFNLENLKKKYSGIIQRVYLGVQCQTCGIRFVSTAMDKYNEHLDWHFRKNRREKEEMKVAKFRRWYYDVVDWIQFEELSSPDDQLQTLSLLEPVEASKVPTVLESQASNVVTCPMASRDDKEDICDTCRESFEQFWDEEKEAWHLRDAILVDGKTYHPICYEDAKDQVSFGGTSMSEDDTSALEVTVNHEMSGVCASDEQDKNSTQGTTLPSLDNSEPGEILTELKTDIVIKLESINNEEIEPASLNQSRDVFTPEISPSENDQIVIVKSEPVEIPDLLPVETVAAFPVEKEIKDESIE